MEQIFLKEEVNLDELEQLGFTCEKQNVKYSIYKNGGLWIYSDNRRIHHKAYDNDWNYLNNKEQYNDTLEKLDALNMIIRKTIDN